MKIYVASHSRSTALQVSDVLSYAGHKITSRWINNEFKPTEEHTENERRQIANEV